MKLKPHQKIEVLSYLFNHDGEVLYISLISKYLCVTRSLVSRYINDLVKRGLISFSVGDCYRQRKYIKLTDKGRDVCACLGDYLKLFKEVLG